MKWFCFWILGMLSTFSLCGQSCKVLDKSVFFKSIGIGNQIPADLLLCTKKTGPANRYYSGLRIQYDSLSLDCKKKYSDLFTFLLHRFSYTELATNQSGEFYTLQMYSFFESKHLGDSITYTPPATFVALYKKLKLLYGEPLMVKGPTGQDSLFIKESGIEQKIDWYCDSIHLQLRVYYGAREKMLNSLTILFTNRDYDRPEQLQRLQ
jgi:hypothetical protein